MSKKLVTVLFDNEQAEGTVSLYDEGDDLRITISADWEDGRTVIQTATINQTMAGVLVEEIVHWLKSKSAPAPSAGAEPRED